MHRLWLVGLLGVLWGCHSTAPTEAGLPALPAPPAATDVPPPATTEPSPVETSPVVTTPPVVAPLPCSPQSCQTLGYACGDASDGCGGALYCGTCTGSETCQGANHQCAPAPPPSAACSGTEPTADLEPVSGGVHGARECLPNGWCSSNGYMDAHWYGLWGSSERDVWVVGGPQVLHWDGQQWTEQLLPESLSVDSLWGASPSDVWAVGARGSVVHWDGTAWRRVSVPTTEGLTGVSGSSAEDVWLVGAHLALHWDGHSFQETPGWTSSPTTPDQGPEGWATHVWVLGPHDVLTASGSVCQRWNGQTWAVTDCGVRDATAVWASGPEDIWVVGSHPSPVSNAVNLTRSHWDGARWSVERIEKGDSSEDEEPFSALWGSGPGDVWLNGTWHFDGQQWSRVCAPQAAQSRLWGSGQGVLFGLSNGYLRTGVERLEAGHWRQVVSMSLDHPAFVRMPGGGSLAVSPSGARLAWDGERWSGTPPGAGPPRSHLAPFGTSSEDLWSLDRGLSHWDGQTWSDPMAVELPLSSSFSKGWSSSPTDAFVLSGQSGAADGLWRWNGATWNRVQIDLTRTQLEDVWGSGPEDVWVVGQRWPTGGSACQCVGGGESLGVAWHWDGRTWSLVYEQSGHHLTRVFGTSRSEVWVMDFHPGTSSAPSYNLALHWDGSTFQPSGQFMDSDSDGYTHLAGTGPDDLWVSAGLVPEGGSRLYHFDGTAWSEREPLPGRVNSMSALPGRSTFLVTEQGAFYERPR